MSLTITFSNKWVYTILVASLVLIFSIGAIAYESDMRSGQPELFGHSAGEVNVEIDENTMNLQDAIENLQDAIDFVRNESLKITDHSFSHVASYSLFTEFRGGTRSPADKISNYIIVPQTDLLTSGKEYAFVLFTSGERNGQRTFANGDTFSSRCYNSAGDKPASQFRHFLSSPGSQMYFSYQGTFLHDPVTVIGAQGNTDIGTLIAKNTYCSSDSGKGGYRIFIYEKDVLEKILSLLYDRYGDEKFIYKDELINS